MSNVVKKTYHSNGQIRSESYYENDKQHRLDGPAEIWYYKNGQIESEYYCINDKYHRLDGPARIYYYENGQIKCEYYYINDKLFFKGDFYKHPQVIEYLENKKFYETVEEVLGN